MLAQAKRDLADIPAEDLVFVSLSVDSLVDTPERLAAFAAALKGEASLIGVGGILRGEHAAGKLEAGASLVQLYTGLIYRGPGLVDDVLAALARA